MLGLVYVRHNPYSVFSRAHNSDARISSYGWLEVSGEDLVFTGYRAQVKMPLNGLQFYRNRWWGGAICFTHRDCPGWELKTTNTRLLNDPAFEQYPSLSEIKERCRIYFRNTRVALKFCCLVTFLLLLFPASRNCITDFVVQFVPIEREVAWGDAIYSELRKEKDGQFITDGAVDAQMEKIYSRLIDSLPATDKRFHFRIHIIASRDINAFAIPGGHIFINSALISESRSPEEMAGIIGHEMGHVTRRHALASVIQNWGMLAAVKGLHSYPVYSLND